MITSARYITQEHVPIGVIMATGATLIMPAYPSGTHYDTAMQEYLDGGGSVALYDMYFDVSDVDIKEEKYALNAALAQTHVEAAEATPVVGATLTTREAKKENLRRENRGRRNSGMTDADDAMADYVDEVMDTLDLADDQVEDLNREQLIAWDGSTIVWPIWSPPV